MEEDIIQLRNFVSKVYHWLRACYIGETSVEKPIRWPLIPVHPDLAESAVQAWKEFEEEYPIDRLLSPLDPERKELWNILESHGLLRAQLKYKLNLVEMVAKNAFGFTKWKQKFISVIDIIIESLGATGIAGGLKELKDALTVSLPD
jgi:hypothetical protein